MGIAVFHQHTRGDLFNDAFRPAVSACCEIRLRGQFLQGSRGDLFILHVERRRGSDLQGHLPRETAQGLGTRGKFGLGVDLHHHADAPAVV